MIAARCVSGTNQPKLQETFYVSTPHADTRLAATDIDPSAADRWRDEFRCQDDVHDAFLGTITVVRSNPA